MVLSRSAVVFVASPSFIANGLSQLLCEALHCTIALHASLRRRRRSRIRMREDDRPMERASEWKATVCLRGRTRRAGRGGECKAQKRRERRPLLIIVNDDAADHREENAAPLVYLLGSRVHPRNSSITSRNQTLCLETGSVLIFSSYYLDLILSSCPSSTYSSPGPPLVVQAAGFGCILCSSKRGALREWLSESAFTLNPCVYLNTNNVNSTQSSASPSREIFSPVRTG